MRAQQLLLLALLATLYLVNNQSDWCVPDAVGNQWDAG